MNLRMPNVNTVTISGNLTRDPRLAVIESGAKVLTLSLAHNDRYKAKDGEWKDKVCYIEVVAWNRLAERMAEKLTKGSPVMVGGKLQLKRWNAADGSKRSRHEIVALSIQSLEKTISDHTPPAASYEEEAPEYTDDVPF